MTEVIAKPKKKKMKWWIWSIVAIILVAIIAVGGVLIHKYRTLQKNSEYRIGVENPHGFFYLGIRPDLGSSLSFAMPEDEEEIISLAATLYQTAATNAKDTGNLAVYNDCQSIFALGSMQNFIDVNVVMLKNQNQYFRMEYHLKNSIPLFDIMPGMEETLNDLIQMVTTERQYYETGMDKMLYQKTLNNQYDENGVPFAQWHAEKITEEERPAPVFNKDQEGIFELTQHYVSAETIKSAEVEYNSEDGFYKVTIVLDETNPLTTETSINSIRNGTGDDNARFTEISMEYTVWDNGYFKSLSIIEKWSAKVVFAVGSTFDNHYYFSYNQRDNDFDTYKDAKEMILSLQRE